jgi:hypothetical protein
MKNFRVLNREEIEDKKWDASIKNANNGLPYAYSFYLDLCCDEWIGLVWDDYEAVCPLPFTIKFGLKLGLQPPFTQQLGYFGKKPAQIEAISEITAYLNQNFSFYNYNLNFQNSIGEINARVKYYPTHHLKLSAKIEDIRKGYGSRRKRDLKKAGKNQLSIIRDDNIESTIDLVRKQFGRQEITITAKHLLKLSALLYNLKKRNMLKVYNAYSNRNEHLSSSAFIIDRDIAISLVIANSEEGLQCGSNTLIFDQFIADHCESDMVLDFEGSKIKGISDYFKSFGATEVNFANLQKQNGFISAIIKSYLRFKNK